MPTGVDAVGQERVYDMGEHMNSSTPSQVESASAGGATGGLDRADIAFRTVCGGTSRLVQLLADEMVPLGDETFSELVRVVERIGGALPDLAGWRGDNRVETFWLLEPPFVEAGVHLDGPDDLLNFDNVERLRRSFEFLAPGSLALRRETACLVVDVLLALLRKNASET